MISLTYQARVERRNQAWLVEVDGIDQATQAHSLDEVDRIVKRTVAANVQGNPDNVDVHVDFVLPHDAQELLNEARELFDLSDVHRQEAAAKYRAAVRALRDDRISTADIGRILHVSKARVSQLTKT